LDPPAQSATLAAARHDAAALGLAGPLAPPTSMWASGASARHMAAGEALASSFRERAMLSREGGAARLQTALARWAEFVAVVGPDLVPFIPAAVAGDTRAACHAERTLGMFAEFMRASGSRARGHMGEAVRGDTIAALVSQVRMHRGLEAGYKLLTKEQLLLPAAAKRMRQEDGPATQRALRLGLRARHMRAAAAAGFDITSWWGVVRWALLRIGLSALARGGDLGVPEGKVFDPRRGLCWSHVQWVAARDYDGRYPVVVLWMVPTKDVSARKKRVPVPVRRRLPEGQIELSLACTYEALRASWRAQEAVVPEAERDATAFFRTVGGRVVTTADVRVAVRCAAAAAGVAPETVGAHSLRIGGATDFLERFGPAKATALVKARGRWESDISEIYSRASALAQIDASVEVWEAEGPELEAVTAGWARLHLDGERA
jgi:hypothetical protein